MKGKGSQNLFMSKKCVQMYFKIIVLLVVLVMTLYLIHTNFIKTDESSLVVIDKNISNSNFNENNKLNLHMKGSSFVLDTNISNSKFKRTNELSLHTKGSSFVLALKYYEQLTCATRNLFVLFKVAQNLDARVVTPFLWNSLLDGIPNDVMYDPTVKTHYYPLDIVYNIPKLNETFHLMSGTYFVTFKELIETAPRDVVVIDTQQPSNSVSNGSAYTIDAGFKVFNCKSYIYLHLMNEAHAIVSKLKKFTKYFNTEEFAVKTYICISPSADTTTDEIRQYIGPDPRTIIFTQWRGCAYHSCDIKAPRSFSNHFRYRILYHSVDTKQKFGFMNLPYDDTIKVHAGKFLEYLKIHNPYISVHVRIEKLKMVDAEVNGYTDCCLSVLDGLLKSLKLKYPKINNTIAVTDVGEYGSTACRVSTCLNHAKKVKGELTNMGLNLVSFDPKITGASRNSAYVSLVEMNMLAMGDLLIVVGKGSFKYRLINQFLQSNPISRVYHVCTEQGNKLNDASSIDKKCS